MNLNTAVEQVSSKFVYQADTIKRFDSWRVMKLTDGIFKGDCDDFVITVLWYTSGKSLWRFLFHLLITHKYKVYNVSTSDGEPHIVASYKNQWFDNFTMAPFARDAFFQTTKHKYRFQIIGPVISIYLLIGLFIS
jgi:hypothetical protein